MGFGDASLDVGAWASVDSAVEAAVERGLSLCDKVDTLGFQSEEKRGALR